MLNGKLATEAMKVFEAKHKTNITQDENTGCMYLEGAKPRTTFTYKGYQFPVYRWVLLAIENYLEPEQLALHSCDNACCFNPQHLRKGTRTENNKDRAFRR